MAVWLGRRKKDGWLNIGMIVPNYGLVLGGHWHLIFGYLCFSNASVSLVAKRHNLLPFLVACSMFADLFAGAFNSQCPGYL